MLATPALGLDGHHNADLPGPVAASLNFSLAIPSIPGDRGSFLAIAHGHGHAPQPRIMVNSLEMTDALALAGVGPAREMSAMVVAKPSVTLAMPGMFPMRMDFFHQGERRQEGDALRGVVVEPERDEGRGGEGTRPADPHLGVPSSPHPVLLHAHL